MPLERLPTDTREQFVGFRIVKEQRTAVGLEGLNPTVIVTAIATTTGAAGAAGGLWAWWVAGRVMRRLGKRT